MSNPSNHALTSFVSAVFAVACLAVPGLAHAKRPSLSQFPFTYGSATTSGVQGTGEQTATHGQSGMHGHAGTQGQSGTHGQAGAHRHNPQYLLVTMRGGSSLQGSQMNQLRRQGGRFTAPGAVGRRRQLPDAGATARERQHPDEH